MTNQTCVIFGAGEYYAQTPVVPDGALVIAADGGLDHSRAFGIHADIVIGDFDSLHGARPADTAHTITLPSEKDDPDMLSALKVGWTRGCREFHIYGALGGRIDHTISGIQLMTLLAHHGGIGFLYGDGTIVTAICDGALLFTAHDAKPGRMVSVFAHSGTARGVNEPGLKYELLDGTLTDDTVLGLSNEFRPDTPAEINVHDGTLIVTFPAEVPMPTVTRYRSLHGDLGALDTHVSSLLVQ